MGYISYIVNFLDNWHKDVEKETIKWCFANKHQVCSGCSNTWCRLSSENLSQKEAK